MSRGKLFVIEGTDASGKATQTKLLAQALRKKGRKVRTIAFPQYGRSSAAPIEAYLRGEYGSLKEVGPYRASIFYAIDRLTARQKILRWLNAGDIVIADRYIASNWAHQGAKISNWRARKRFWIWSDEFEFTLLGIPEPDLTIVLVVPPAVSQRLVLKKSKRDYLGRRKRDIHERDRSYQERVAKTYGELTLLDRRMKIIDCAPSGELLSIPDIHLQVMTLLNRRLK